MKTIVIDGAKISSRAEAHKHLKEVFSFPDYYGNNLDALHDCLSDITDEIKIELINYDSFISYESNCHKGFIRVFQDISDEKDNIEFEIKY